jgi:hypothetical protein
MIGKSSGQRRAVMTPGPRRTILMITGTLLLAAAPLAGQEPTAPEPQQQPDSVVLDSAVLGARRGLEAARFESTTNWVWGGFFGGLTLGPIGAGLAWTLANNSDVALGVDRRMLLSYDGGVAYIHSYEDAFAEALLERRKKSALRGGIIGTAALAATVTAIWAVYYYY